MSKIVKERLDEHLVRLGLAESRSQAQRMILAGEVSAGDTVLDKPGRLIAESADVRLREMPRFVSRGGLKLEAALKAFGISPADWVCADIGASTGGFTDCLLQSGARRVYAIDVGYGQLAWSLRQDESVISMERANIRYLESLPEPANLAVIDVSFIGLNLVLPPARTLLGQGGQIVALIKPQFEVGKGQLGKGGVVKDPEQHRQVLRNVLRQAEGVGLRCAGLIRSPVIGPAGNIEFLAWFI